MGRRGKKKPSGGSVGAFEQGGGERTVETPLQPQPRKRGRPKKIPVEKAEEEEEAAEEEEEEEEEEETKKSKSPKEFTGKAGESSSARPEKGNDDDDVVYSKTKPKVVKREGTSRRKSEPHRAAE